MSDDLPPPTPLPRAAQAPYPAHPKPHPVAHKTNPEAGQPKQAVEERHTGPALRTIALIGGGAAAVLGLVWSLTRKRVIEAKGKKGTKAVKASGKKKGRTRQR